MLGAMDIKDIVRRLRQFAKSGNVTEFAAASRVSRATLYRIMDGWANPTMQTLQRVETELDKRSPKDAR
jgi:DNA-binding phage protein